MFEVINSKKAYNDVINGTFTMKLEESKSRLERFSKSGSQVPVKQFFGLSSSLFLSAPPPLDSSSPSPPPYECHYSVV